MSLAAIMALVAAGTHATDLYIGDVRRRKGIKRAHKFAPLLASWANQQFDIGSPVITKGVRQAQSRFRSGSRVAGTYRPDVAARPLAEMDIDLAKALAQLKAGLGLQAYQMYEAKRAQVPAAMPPDVLGATLGAMDIYGAAQESPYEEWARGMLRRRPYEGTPPRARTGQESKWFKDLGRRQFNI